MFPRLRKRFYEHMPILAAEPTLHPAEMFANSPIAPVLGVDWWVLHTKPRQEKSLARWLHATGISYYLPTLTRRCRVRNRVLTSHQPLFTGYVFAHADRDHRVSAMSTNRVVRCLPVADQEGLWNDLKQVHLLLSSGLPVTPEPRLRPGTPVEVVSGPLRGVTGIVLRLASGNRLVVRVNFIQQGASVLIDDFALQPTDQARAGRM
jgi:transcriptional antiterminator RfaH